MVEQDKVAERKERETARIEAEVRRSDAQRHGDLIAGMGDEQRNRDRAVLNAFHPGTVPKDESSPDAPVDFDGGARPAASGGTPAPTTWASDEPGWRETEVDAALLFPWIEDERG